MPIKTLIINGSPRKNGDTAVLIEAFTGHLRGEVRVVSPDDGINPCSDCRRCRTQPGCALKDRMQDVYPYLEECDILALASPIWFSQVSGPLLTIASRLQTYFCARHFRGAASPIRPKKSVLLLAGAESGTEEMAIGTASTILKHCNALPIAAIVRSMDTDRIPAAKDPIALKQARDAAELLNASLGGDERPESKP